LQPRACRQTFCARIAVVRAQTRRRTTSSGLADRLASQCTRPRRREVRRRRCLPSTPSSCRDWCRKQKPRARSPTGWSDLLIDRTWGGLHRIMKVTIGRANSDAWPGPSAVTMVRERWSAAENRY
jgi:hypothetical protein